MKFILIPLGSAGDVFPFVGLAEALQGRGHNVVLLINDYFVDAVRRARVPYQVLSSADEYLQVAQDPRIWHPLLGPRTVMSFAVKLVEPIYDAIRANGSATDSIVVSSCLGWGARLAQERDGYPLVTVDLQPAMFFSAVDPPRLVGLSPRAPAWWNRFVYRTGERLYLDRVSCPAINALRLPVGLPAMRRITDWWHSPECILGMFPAWFATPQPDWPAQARLTEFPLWDDGRLSSLPNEVMRFLDDGDPPIVITPGSANPCDRAFWDAVVTASQLLGRRAMLLSRFSRSIPDHLPSGVQHFEYASFAQLLPRAAAVVHHGGIGTTARAFAAGIPQVIQPFSHDQPDNANRVSRLGVGAMIPRKRFKANRLASELDRLLHDATVAARCRDLAGRIQRVDPFARSCEVLCELAERRTAAVRV